MISLASDLTLMRNEKLGTTGPVSSSEWWYLIFSVVNPRHSQNMRQGPGNLKAIFLNGTSFKAVCVSFFDLLSDAFFSCLFFFLIIRRVWESKFYVCCMSPDSRSWGPKKYCKVCKKNRREALDDPRVK